MAAALSFRLFLFLAVRSKRQRLKRETEIGPRPGENLVPEMCHARDPLTQSDADEFRVDGKRCRAPWKQFRWHFAA